MERFRLLNNLTGWFCFACAFSVYLLTLQPSVSFWDCGEFIAAAYRLQVGHQPGAPLFILIGKLFSLLAADARSTAFFLNLLSALASALTILFLFWTITALARKLLQKQSFSCSEQLLILGAGVTGALAYTFSDSFWFSAVEAEVYALSSLCTAVVFWAALKWDAVSDQPSANKWLLVIAYLIGLSIGLHLLSLLSIPAIFLLIYFKRSKKISTVGTIAAFGLGCLVLAFVQYGIVQYLVLLSFKSDYFFVNTLHLGFHSGALFFILLLVVAVTIGLLYSHRRKLPGLNLSLLCLSFLLLGYSSYAMIVIRAEAKTAINISNPDNAFSLFSYLGRLQYGETPLLYGPYFDSQPTEVKDKRTLYRKGKAAYEEAGERTSYHYDRNTIFPRIYSEDAAHVNFYRNWLNIPEGEKANFSDNIRFFSTYQMGFMYFRYFLWNFAGKQNDEQGMGDGTDGNWKTGIKAIDELRLGSHDNLPQAAIENEGNNSFFALPLLLGLAGLIYQFRRRKEEALVVTAFFFCTGLAIVLYLNQSPLQVRERDYAYVGSFYAFAIWIGLGVLALNALVTRLKMTKASISLAIASSLSVPLVMGWEGWDDHDRSGNYIAHDMAVNYLQSCAPNAILFCNADNDTYPLWYAQQVEGIRTDVRLVNLQLLFDPDYITALKKELDSAAPLPITMPEEKYQAGKRDVLYYLNYGIPDSVELKDIFEVLTSDNPADQVEMNDGRRANFLPSKNFQLTVDKEKVLASGMIKDRSKIADKMKWAWEKDYVTRADLAAIDILAHNNWKRPIYFSNGLSSDSYLGLHQYLYLEGYTYRLLPIKRKEQDLRDKSELTNTDVFYSNFKSKLKLNSFNKAAYLDPESRRIGRQSWNLLNTLAENLVQEKRTSEAREVVRKAILELPMRNYGIIDTVSKYRAAATSFNTNDTKQAVFLVQDALGFLKDQLNYLSSLDDEEQQQRSRDIRTAISILSEFRKLADGNRQPLIVREIDEFLKQTQLNLQV
ncbi:DUF2723 domain-containing protein [Pedobacter sp. SYSU D00535]|uniref:glycosyltransferase family 117 protein n=1 Tax=Pedobacter sp. SYSU D00535 TaxID=2810308 RepID=UPI001A975559|nr:DUF2723 domain-containing protein [Pedobacter sp. SYSU D00535]